jgi:hypothetical protein
MSGEQLSSYQNERSIPFTPWLHRMAAQHYRSAKLVFGWSFYRQGTSGGSSSADEFLTPLSPGLEIPNHVSEGRGRRVKDWQSLSPDVEPCLSWMAWSHSKIRQVHKKDAYVNFPCRPLFLAVICGCSAGLSREALHEVYVPQIQRGNASFAAKVLRARGALLSVLAHFFEHCRWGSPAERHSSYFASTEFVWEGTEGNIG